MTDPDGQVETTVELPVASDDSTDQPTEMRSSDAPEDNSLATFSSSPDTFVDWWLLGISSFVICAAILMNSEGDERVFLPGFSIALPELCSTKRIFNINCPGCGLTRAFISLAHGDFTRAWHFHPTGILLFGIIAFQIPFRIFQLWRIYSGRNPLRVKHFEWIFYALCVVMLAQWIGRMFW